MAPPSAQSTAPEPGPETPRNFAASGIVAPFVGKKRKKFEIHKDLLLTESTYFKLHWQLIGKKEEAMRFTGTMRTLRLSVSSLIGSMGELWSVQS